MSTTPPSGRGPRNALPSEYGQWLDYFERRLRSLEAELESLRAFAAQAAPAQAAPSVEPRTVEPAPAKAPQVAPPPAPAAPPRAPSQPVPAAAARPPRRPKKPAPPRIKPADLVGARALAWAGGLVTLLGIVFFFVLAVNRGWVSEELRVALGAAVSGALFGAALFIRRRYGNMVAALGAAGAAIGGAYATLVAATALYEFLTAPQALVAAAAIALVGVVTALRWDHQLTAVLGLVGAMLGPPLIEGEATVLGVAFVGVVLAGALAVSLARDWIETAIAASLASVYQVAWLVADRDAVASDWPFALLGALFAGLYTAAALAGHFLPARRSVENDVRTLATLGWTAAGLLLAAVVVTAVTAATPLAILVIAIALCAVLVLGGYATGALAPSDTALRGAAPFVTGGIALTAAVAFLWFGDRAEGWALLVAAGLVLTLLVPLQGRDRRDLASVLWAAGLALAAIAAGDLLTGETRALVWAAQAALVSVVALRAREPRLHYGAFVYAGLALVQAVGLDAPPRQFLFASESPAAGLAAVLFAAAGIAATAFAYLRQSRAEGRWYPDRLRTAVGGGALAALLGLYALALGILGAFQAGYGDGRMVAAFDDGHAAVTLAWSLVALALLSVAVARRSRPLHAAAVAVFAVVAAKVLAFDQPTLFAESRGWAFLGAGTVALAAGFLHGVAGERVSAYRLRDVHLHPVTLVLHLASALALVPALRTLLDGDIGALDRQGAGLVAGALVYGALATAVFRAPGERDLATLLWAIGLVFLGGGIVRDLLDQQWTVTAFAAITVVLAVLSRLLREERFMAAALAFAAPAALYTLGTIAPPADLFVRSADPAAGAPSVLVLTIAAFVVALLIERPRYRPNAFWVAGALALYVASLGILGAFQAFAADDAESVATAFQRGHTAVSSFWGIAGLVLLAVGLARRWTALRVGGLALFAIALAKIFLYDLSTLSSMARALSFLGVGSVLLLAAFLYQRLTESPEDQVPSTTGAND